MHPRLRRQLDAASVGDLSPALRKLLAAVEEEYRERDELHESLRTLTGLLHRAQQREAGSEQARAERRTQASKAARRLSRALDKSRVPVVELTPALEVRSGNEAAARLCGVPREELAKQPLFSLLEPLEPEALREKWMRKLARGEPVARTIACTAKGGRALACDFVLVPRAFRDGELRRVTAILRDETPTVEKQDELREREERSSLALSGTSDVLWRSPAPATCSGTGTCGRTGSSSRPPGASCWARPPPPAAPRTGSIGCTPPTRPRCGRRWPRTSRDGPRRSSTSTGCATPTASSAGWRCAERPVATAPGTPSGPPA